MSVRFYAENYEAIREVEVAPAVTAEHGLSPMQNAGGLLVVISEEATDDAEGR